MENLKQHPRVSYYLINENFTEPSTTYVHLDNTEMINCFVRFERSPKIRTTIDGNILKKVVLKPRKRNWTEENTTTYLFKIVKVGEKKQTSKLSAGTLYQLIKC
jgi:hypothetical protein